MAYRGASAELSNDLSQGAIPANAPTRPPGTRQEAVGMNLSPEMQGLIAETAQALGVSPLELATQISYETGGSMDPMQPGPTTKWGQHRGLIQFGEPQAEQYGVDFSSPEAALRSQLGKDGAIVKYALAHGFKPGEHNGLNLYATINAGNPNKTGASDEAAGGAPGTVADKYYKQMGAHRAKFSDSEWATNPAGHIRQPGAIPDERTKGQKRADAIGAFADAMAPPPRAELEFNTNTRTQDVAMMAIPEF